MNNDLISREYVKAKMFDIPKPKEGENFWDGVDTVGEIIDNAPTVEDTANISKSNFSSKQYNADLQTAYDCGYAQGYIDGSTGADMKGGAENE